MNSKDRRKYVDAIMPVIGKRCIGKAWPIVMDAMGLLNEACRRADLPHSYSVGQSKQVVYDLFEEIDRRCFAHEDTDVFPVKVIKCTASIVDGVGHGRELVIDERFNADWYSSRAYARRNDEHVGFVFFCKQASREHPIVAASFRPRAKAMRTEMNRHNKRVNSFSDAGLVGLDEKLGLTVEPQTLIGIEN